MRVNDTALSEQKSSISKAKCSDDLYKHLKQISKKLRQTTNKKDTEHETLAL